LSEFGRSQGLPTSTDAKESDPGGRHPDDAALTPIFHALAHSGWEGPQESPDDSAVNAVLTPDDVAADPVETFRRDPLGAPLPAATTTADEPVLAAPGPPAGSRRRSRAHEASEPRRGGRHHRRLVPLDGGADSWPG